MTKVTRLTLDEEGGLDRRHIHLREISGDLETPLETVGQDLRAARLRRGDDLATVSRVLKIRKDHLEALEEDRMEALPGRTYAVGFTRSYADYLGLDAVQCVERLKAEIAGRSDETTPAITVIDEDEHRRLPQGWKIIAGVVLVLVLYGAYQLAVSADRMLNEPVTAPPPQQMLPGSAIVARQKPAPAEPVVVQQPLATSPADTAAPPAAQTPGPEQTAAPDNSQLQSSGVSEPLPRGQVYGAQNRNARVVLRMRQAARILVEGPDGVLFINRTLKPGDTYQVPNVVGATLTTSNAGAVELDLDGTVVGFVGKNNETAEALSLDPQAIMDRHNSGQFFR
jgi:cytoskeleton protein RodZ